MFYLQNMGKTNMTFHQKLNFAFQTKNRRYSDDTKRNQICTENQEKNINFQFFAFFIGKNILYMYFVKCICLKFLFTKGKVTNFTE